MAIAAAALALAAPAAEADFTQVGSTGGRVCDAESTGVRLAVRLCDGDQPWRVSSDHGATWTIVDRGSLNRIAGFGHAGDTLVAYGNDVDGPVIATLAPGSTVAGFVSLAVPSSYFTVGGLADADGTHRVVVGRPDSRRSLLTVAADGTVTGTTDVTADAIVRGVTRLADDALALRATTGWVRVPRGGAAEPLPTGPVLADLGNGTRAGPSGIFINGTAVDNRPFTTTFSAVPGAAGLFIQRPGILLRRVAEDLFLPLAGQPPADSTVIADAVGIYAIDQSGAVHAGSLTDRPAGAVPEAIAAVNALRAEAGIAPLTADAGISGALANGGSPGCLTTCGTLATSTGLAAAEAGRAWVAAGLAGVTDPRATRAGAAQGPDGRQLLYTPTHAALLLRPRGYPTGTYSGPLSIAERAGLQTQFCRHLGSQRISAPFGATISVAMPLGGSVSGLDLHRVGDPRPIRACRAGDVLIPDDALVPGAEYEAIAQWRVGAALQTPFTWRFRTAGAPAAAVRSTARLHRLRIVGGRWTLRLSAAEAVGQPATVRVRRGRKVSKRTITLKAENAIKLPARRGWKVTVDIAAFSTPTGAGFKATHLSFTRK